MEFEKTSGPLRKLGERLFNLMTQLAGAPPLCNKGGWYQWYQTPPLYLYFVGEKARKHPKNSVLAAVSPLQHGPIACPPSRNDCRFWLR